MSVFQVQKNLPKEKLHLVSFAVSSHVCSISRKTSFMKDVKKTPKSIPQSMTWQQNHEDRQTLL